MQPREPLSGVDTTWLRMDSPSNLMVIHAMMVLDKVDYAAFSRHIASRLLRFSRFRQRPVRVSGSYYWEDDPWFHLDNHLHQVALPGKADKAALQHYLADLLSVPLDKHRPLWQMYFVENYQDGVALIVRVHHCYADGIALIQLLHSITDAKPLPQKLRAVAVEKIHDADEIESHLPMALPWPLYQHVLEAAVHTFERYEHLGQRVSDEGRHLLHDSSALKSYLKKGARGIAEVARLALMPSDPKTCLKGTLGIRKACAWSEPLPLAWFADISHALGCKINDLLLSCVAGALRAEMLRAGESVADKQIHVTVPVNIRSLAAAAEPALGNCFGMVFVSLPVGIANPLERVYRLKHEMEVLKQSVQPATSYALLCATGWLPGKLQRPLMALFCKKSSGVLSNVPGPRTPRYMAGARIREQMFWVPQTADIGLGLSIISYAGQVQFGMIADAGLFQNPDRVVRQCVAELDLHRPERFLAPGKAEVAPCLPG